jgi:hypothetical protein
VSWREKAKSRERERESERRVQERDSDAIRLFSAFFRLLLFSSPARPDQSTKRANPLNTTVMKNVERETVSSTERREGRGEERERR